MRQWMKQGKFVIMAMNKKHFYTLDYLLDKVDRTKQLPTLYIYKQIIKNINTIKREEVGEDDFEKRFFAYSFTENFVVFEHKNIQIKIIDYLNKAREREPESAVNIASFVTSIKNYLPTAKNYLLSNPLCNALERTKTKALKFSDLPQASLCIELNNYNIKMDNSIVDCAFITSATNKHKKYLSLYFFLENGATRRASIKGDAHETIEEISKKYLDTFTDQELKTFSFYINAMLYIYNCDESLREQIDFSRPTTAKHFIAEQGNNAVYKTKKDFTYVGRNFHKQKMFSKNEWIRSAHFRWQRHGPMLSQIKLIVIEEQIVKRNN